MRRNWGSGLTRSISVLLALCLVFVMTFTGFTPASADEAEAVVAEAVLEAVEEEPAETPAE